MEPAVVAKVNELLVKYGSDRTRLLDMLWEIHDEWGYLPSEVLAHLGDGLGMTLGEVQQTSTFYHLFRHRPSGRHQIYLSRTVVAKQHGYQEVLAALERETGAKFGQVDPTGTFGLFETHCIGLSDQEPAMLVDKVPFSRLRPGKVADIIHELRQGVSAAEIANPAGMPTTVVDYVEALVETNVRTRGPVFFRHTIDYEQLLRDCVVRTPEQIHEEISESGLRGRGGAGFPTGLKWQLCRTARGDRKHVICNADEGEPGTFKDRVLLTRVPKQVFFGMVACAYAIGGSNGIVYLRAEYAYLRDYLEAQLQEMRDQGLLGDNILGRRGFNFDIRIQLGAGSYVCGEESALIESLEGKRGTPRLKPPFPAQAGYLGEPTCIDNVESFATITAVLDEGAQWFASLGTPDSRGTRLLSVAGDCARPGIYEIEFGVTLQHVLDLVGANDAWAVQVSGPSGECVSAKADAMRTIAFEDLPCNGSLTIFDHERDLLRIVREYMHFFVEESCGICTPCRVGNVDLRNKVEMIMEGKGRERDLEQLAQLGAYVRGASRCGLGATSPKPILTTLERFPEVYRNRLRPEDTALLASFDEEAAIGGWDKAVAQIDTSQLETGRVQ
jgi:[NiFe] hydrogenase diaphorase moiety large subunit